jgi:hypothetical protein
VSHAAPPLPETTSRRGLVVGLVVGLPVVAYGLRGMLVDADDTHPVDLARWIVGSALVTDLLVIPAVVAVGWLLRRLTPAGAWPAVRGALVTTGVLCLVAWPFLRRYGRDPTNPSLLPRDYGAGLARAVVVVWLVAAAWLLVTAWQRRRRAL